MKKLEIFIKQGNFSYYIYKSRFSFSGNFTGNQPTYEISFSDQFYTIHSQLMNFWTIISFDIAPNPDTKL